MDVTRRDFLKTAGTIVGQVLCSPGSISVPSRSGGVVSIPKWVEATRSVLELFIKPNLDRDINYAFTGIRDFCLKNHSSSSTDPITSANDSAFTILNALETLESISPGWIKFLDNAPSLSRFDISEAELVALGDLLKDVPSFDNVRNQLNLEWHNLDDDSPARDVGSRTIAFRFYETLDELSVLSKNSLYRLTNESRTKGSVGVHLIKLYLNGGLNLVKNHPWYRLKKELEGFKSTPTANVEHFKKKKALENQVSQCEAKFKKADARPPSPNNTVTTLAVRSKLRNACDYILNRDDNPTVEINVNVDEVGNLGVELMDKKSNIIKLPTELAEGFSELFSRFNIQLKPNTKSRLYMYNSTPQHLIEILLGDLGDLHSSVFISDQSMAYLLNDKPQVYLNVWDTPAVSI